MPKLHETIVVIEASLAAPGACDRDPKAFQSAAARLEALRADLIAAEAEWLDIELKREALASEE